MSYKTIRRGISALKDIEKVIRYGEEKPAFWEGCKNTEEEPDVRNREGNVRF